MAKMTATHSPKYDKVLNYYTRGLWNETMVRNAAYKWLTPDEVEEILSMKQEEGRE